MLLSHEIDVLVVESQATMRAQLRNMLTSIGIEAPQFAVSATMAMRRLRAQRYDLVLCEYNLGEGQDGQHLLEDLRLHQIIPLDTLFVMITAERNFERVTSACELVPNDYILKPLTAETLRVRLLRAFEKRDAFLPAWQLMRIGDPVGAIAYCRIARDEHPQHLVDFMRLQAELHAGIGQIAEAETLYREILSARPIPWASLGLARMLVLKKSWVEAEHILTELLARHDRFIEAYELLASLREATGRQQEACAALQRAAELSPYRITRLRRLGELALDAGDAGTAARSLADAVERGKYSEFRDPEDHVRLLQAQLALHKLDEARDTLGDLERSLARHPKGELCAAIGGALIQAHQHDQAGARQSMLAALRNPARLRDLSVGLRQDLLKACYDQQMSDEGTELLADLLRTAGDDRTLESTRAALRARGLDHLSREVEAKVQAEVKALVTTGAQKAHAGDFDGAVAEMMNAARKMPGNPHVLFNAALALLRHIENRGWNEAFATQARTLIDRAQRMAPANPRLAAITEFMHDLMKRFGIGPNRSAPKARQV
ncbi:MAG: response regulator [Thauera sp.]|uniref:response regulator n=1 Tax=Thauera sp. JM12B12 TaxID=3142262 RepID=UPI0029C263AA|nr:response regulator [Thauera sp.]